MKTPIFLYPENQALFHTHANAIYICITMYAFMNRLIYPYIYMRDAQAFNLIEASLKGKK